MSSLRSMVVDEDGLAAGRDLRQQGVDLRRNGDPNRGSSGGGLIIAAANRAELESIWREPGGSRALNDGLISIQLYGANIAARPAKTSRSL